MKKICKITGLLEDDFFEYFIKTLKDYNNPINKIKKFAKI